MKGEQAEPLLHPSAFLLHPYVQTLTLTLSRSTGRGNQAEPTQEPRSHVPRPRPLVWPIRPPPVQSGRNGDLRPRLLPLAAAAGRVRDVQCVVGDHVVDRRQRGRL